MVTWVVRGRLETGGERFDAAWPRSRMEVDPGRIVIEAPGHGRLEFLPEDVLAIEPSVLFPLVDMGVRIRHGRTDLPERVRFVSRTRFPFLLRRGILRAGFVPRGRERETCLACGARLSESAVRCTRCGWSFE